MKTKRFLILAFAVLFITSLLAGCGAKSENAMDMAMDMPAEAPEAAAPNNNLSASSDAGQTVLPENEKIITTLYLDAQTEDMDTILGAVNGKIAELGGYIEAQEIYNGSAYATYRYRYANITIRIPAQRLNDFVEHVSANTNVVSENTTTENITLTYVATQSRITALEAERDRLMELMEMAEDMEDLLLIEARLTEVLSDLEGVTSQIRVYDNLVNYSTVHLNLEEVKEYTPVQEEPETVWERISEGLGKSLKNLGKGIVNFFVFIIVNLPYLVLIGGVTVVIILIIRRCRKSKEKRARKNSEPKEN